MCWLALGLPGMLMGQNQNLVPNGSFEQYRNCPHHDNQLEEAIPWYNPNKATPDFYNHCFDFGQLILPPHSGNGVAHLYIDQGWAEYLGVKLKQPLVAKECYYFEMYVATDTPAKYLPGTIGAYVTVDSVKGKTIDIIKGFPQIVDNTPKNAITRLTWFKISGFITALGGEQFLTIGSYLLEPPFLGYFYLFVDDVSLSGVHLDLGKDTTHCSRQNTYTLDATTPGALEYRWQNGSTQPKFQVTKPGKYSVSVVTGCKVLTDSININYAIDFDLGNDTTLCNGQTMQLAVPPNDSATYRWQDGSLNNTFTVRQEGRYGVTVTQASCVASDSIFVKYIRPPSLDLGPNKELCGAEVFTVKPVIADGNFRWQDGFAGQDRMVTRSGVYWASVQNDCATISDSVVIAYDACDCVLYAPNSFSPNSDGVNDVFLAYGCGDISITSLTIFNRWGEVIYHTTKEPFQWNGYYHGAISETGMYSWSVDYDLKLKESVQHHQKNGPLMLLR